VNGTGAAAAALVGLMALNSGQPAQNIAPVAHEFADVNGVRLHYAKAGTGPLIVFVHGFPEFWYEWKQQLAEFGKDHLAVAPDMRGYNLSSKPTELDDYQMPKLVEDLRALTSGVLKASGQTKFTLVAHDWGGVVAWVFAAQHPEMLDRLVIVNAPHPTVFGRLLREDPEQQKASQYMLMFRSAGAEATLSQNNYEPLVNAVLGAGLRSGTVTDEDKQEYISAWSQPGALTGGLNYYRAAQIGPPAQGGGVPSQEAAAAATPPMVVTVPTLVIWGEKDTALLTSNLDGLDKVVPTLTVKRIPDGTHWVVRENAPEVNRLIREYLARP
jgi:pimeloyl-ACP methyl ester carboxylesterase